MLHLILCLAQELPVLLVERDDTVVSASCLVRIPAGRVIPDLNGDGVLHVTSSGIEVRFEEGSVLRGAPEGAPLNGLEGIGIRVEGASNVALRGLRIEGFRCALLAREADALLVEDGRFARNFGHRLLSTPEAEDGADWLWPHNNDEEEWRRNYGAAISVHDSAKVVLRRNVVRAQQNGILLNRVEDGEIYDNDCSFLSGWGLALWRSNGNMVSRNAFDFCIRGYSHKVYNRGQDSAGILMFEQCSRNYILENSATHGGDGFFGFAGHEAIGEDAPSRADFDYQGKGCNANWFVGNDFSYAAAHGLELTFSFHNRMMDNRLVGNAICGMWLGFCQDTLIVRNVLESNGDMGYGLERGGINIDQSRNNSILANQFARNSCGVHLWRLPTNFGSTPWGKANKLDGAGNVVAGNRFMADAKGLHLRGDLTISAYSNEFASVPEEQLLEGTAAISDAIRPMPIMPTPRRAALGETRPVGARSALAGREHILMAEWGPWDHEEPLVYRLAGGGGAAEYLVLPASLEVTARVLRGEVSAAIQAGPNSRRLIVSQKSAGWTDYAVEIKGLDFQQTVTGTLLKASWEAAFFATDFDPREKADAWQAAAAAALAAHPLTLSDLRLPFGGGGPADVPAVQAAAKDPAALPGREHFGTVARTRVRLPEGRWRVRTNSDDGVRVRVSTQDAPVIDNWTWHGPTPDQGEFEVNAQAAADPAGIEIFVEHFELDGFSVLEFDLERVTG